MILNGSGHSHNSESRDSAIAVANRAPRGPHQRRRWLSVFHQMDEIYFFQIKCPFDMIGNKITVMERKEVFIWGKMKKGQAIAPSSEKWVKINKAQLRSWQIEGYGKGNEEIEKQVVGTQKCAIKLRKAIISKVSRNSWFPGFDIQMRPSEAVADKIA